jgi:hypothetical protein
MRRVVSGEEEYETIELYDIELDLTTDLEEIPKYLKPYHKRYADWYPK